MSPSELLYQKLKKNSVNFIVSVPCKLLSELILIVKKDNEIIYTPVTREEEGVGLVTGAFLAGKRPAVIMQNSGLGNCVNAICSLANYYKISCVFIISQRGGKGEKINAQKPMGNITKDLLNILNIKFYEIKAKKDLNTIDKTINKIFDGNQMGAYLFPFSFWQ